VSLTAAGLIAQLISFVMLITATVLVVGPWMNRRPLAVALAVPLWIHVFRYVALQIFSAQRSGFAVSDALAGEIAWGDVAATVLAAAGLWLLHYRSPVVRLIVWALVVESVIDLANATIGGVRENALDSASGVTWLILNLYVPSLWVTAGLMAWQLLARRGEELTADAGPARSLVESSEMAPRSSVRPV
jgi:hypothetical protein